MAEIRPDTRAEEEFAAELLDVARIADGHLECVTDDETDPAYWAVDDIIALLFLGPAFCGASCHAKGSIESTGRVDKDVVRGVEDFIYKSREGRMSSRSGRE